MKKKVVSFDINLIPKDPFFATPAGQILKWALSIGRYIVIFTELVVILSFVTRFSLDRQVTDLNDAISQKKTVIESYGDLEESVRQIQSVLEEYSLLEQQVNITEVFPELTRIIPRDTVLNELVLRPDQISFSGKTIKQSSLNTIINNIQLSDRFSNVSVDKIESNTTDEGGGFNFVIRANTRKVEVVTQSAREAEKTNILDRSQGIDNL
ncbi:MAG: PilN domain-containing protein [Candidatus Pacebacteria bacterium]|nr:PilN domain-containing protein [Candidatus Paceibacterota bacterium]